MQKMTVFLAVLITLFMVLPTSAQVHLGILGGLNVADCNVDPDEGLDYYSRTGFGAGAVLGYSFSEYIILDLEPMYLEKGTKTEELEINLELRYTYIELPLMFKYAFDTVTYIMAGPTIGWNMSAKVTGSEDGVPIDADTKGETTSVDLGLGFGAGWILPTRNFSIFLEARYVLGLTDVSENTDSIKHNGIQIFAGITFPIGAN
jgi:hypothetical protein